MNASNETLQVIGFLLGVCEQKNRDIDRLRALLQEAQASAPVKEAATPESK